MHTEKSLVHRDIKLENILIEKKNTGDMVVKLADFGMVTNDTAKKEFVQIGSMNYIAPEVLGFKPATHKSDVWSACIVIYSLFQAILPFNGATHAEVIEQINNTKMD